MADDVAGAVRRTPRPTPRADDHQTPETGTQPGAGTTNAPTPVSTDAGNATGDLRASAPGAFCVDGCPCGQTGSAAAACALDTATDVEAYAALPECTACEGTGKDDHGSPFEQPLAVHIAAPPVEIAGRRRQLCMWCGHVLRDVALSESPAPPWPTGEMIRVEDGLGTVVPYLPCDTLPPGCCALPDDEQYTRTASSGPTAQGIPDEIESTVDDCTCSPDRCDRLNVNGQCQHCARLGPGQGGCPAANGRSWTLGDHPAEDAPDEADGRAEQQLTDEDHQDLDDTWPSEENR